MSAVVTSYSVHPYEEIFKDHARLVYRTAYGVTGGHEDAEDVLQTIFLGLIRRPVPSDREPVHEGVLQIAPSRHRDLCGGIGDVLRAQGQSRDVTVGID
jgi:DNA-directed RNA polymerase specialized sigma24 family protein